jgi:hypothetical protein
VAAEWERVDGHLNSARLADDSTLSEKATGRRTSRAEVPFVVIVYHLLECYTPDHLRPLLALHAESKRLLVRLHELDAQTHSGGKLPDHHEIAAVLGMPEPQVDELLTDLVLLGLVEQVGPIPLNAKRGRGTIGRGGAKEQQRICCYSRIHGTLPLLPQRTTGTRRVESWTTRRTGPPRWQSGYSRRPQSPVNPAVSPFCCSGCGGATSPTSP